MKIGNLFQVGTNIGEDQLVAIAERAIVEAKQNLDVPQEPGLGTYQFSYSSFNVLRL